MTGESFVSTLMDVAPVTRTVEDGLIGCISKHTGPPHSFGLRSTVGTAHADDSRGTRSVGEGRIAHVRNPRLHCGDNTRSILGCGGPDSGGVAPRYDVADNATAGVNASSSSDFPPLPLPLPFRGGRQSLDRGGRSSLNEKGPLSFDVGEDSCLPVALDRGGHQSQDRSGRQSFDENGHQSPVENGQQSLGAGMEDRRRRFSPIFKVVTGDNAAVDADRAAAAIPALWRGSVVHQSHSVDVVPVNKTIEHDLVGGNNHADTRCVLRIEHANTRVLMSNARKGTL